MSQDAKLYVDSKNFRAQLIRLAHCDAAGKPDGHARALIIDRAQHMAVMLEDLDGPETMIAAGDVVKFMRHLDGEPTIVGGGAHLPNKQRKAGV